MKKINNKKDEYIQYLLQI